MGPPFFYLYNEKQARINERAPVFNVDYAFYASFFFFRHFYSVVFNMEISAFASYLLNYYHVIILHTHISAAATDYVVYIIVSFTFCYLVSRD